jgi:23S rRNA (adenine2503-C2)-methyltransferase
MVLDLLATPARDLQTLARAHFGAHQGAGVAALVHRQAVRHGVFEPEALGLAAASSATWRQLATLSLPEVAEEIAETLPTGELRKRRLRYADGSEVESVLLPMGRNRHSLCLSTQVGCARACIFCTTGRMGLLRNLSPGEIIAQVTLVHRSLRPHSLVFMGMGEPLDNLDGLLPALAMLVDRHGLGYAQERLTICTVGHVPGIHHLRELGWKRLGLALSLNAADDQQRRELMPHSVRYPLAAIQAALQAFRQRRNLALGIHWCLLPGFNDRDADVQRIAAFCAPLGRCLVHVIPYNPDGQPITRAPTEDEVQQFVGKLRAAGLAVRRRITKGRSVAAACGQLGTGPRVLRANLPPPNAPTSGANSSG